MLIRQILEGVEHALLEVVGRLGSGALDFVLVVRHGALEVGAVAEILVDELSAAPPEKARTIARRGFGRWLAAQHSVCAPEA